MPQVMMMKESRDVGERDFSYSDSAAPSVSSKDGHSASLLAGDNPAAGGAKSSESSEDYTRFPKGLDKRSEEFDADAALTMSPRGSSVRGSVAEFRGSQEFVEAISRGSFDTKMENARLGSTSGKFGSFKDRRTMSQDALHRDEML